MVATTCYVVPVLFLKRFNYFVFQTIVPSWRRTLRVYADLDHVDHDWFAYAVPSDNGCWSFIRLGSRQVPPTIYFLNHGNISRLLYTQCTCALCVPCSCKTWSVDG